MLQLQILSSAQNPTLKAIKKLAQNSVAYKDSQQVWLEGEHLCDAFLLSGSVLQVSAIVLSESSSNRWLARLQALICIGSTPLSSVSVLRVPDALLAQISALPSSSSIGFVLALPAQAAPIQPAVATVVLDGVQDAGNVGSILRSSAAFGVKQILALQGTAALWSPKVLRAGMGAHFALHMVEGLKAEDIELTLPLLCTSSHGGEDLHDLQSHSRIPQPCAWVMGHEGQGVSPQMLAKASMQVRIAQSSQESLNVAAAAAVCLYASRG